MWLRKNSAAPAESNEWHQEPASTARKSFGRIGLSLFVIAAVTVALQFAVSFLIQWLWTQGCFFVGSSWVLWLATFLPLYAVGIPIGLLLMRRVPAVLYQQSKLGGGKFWMLFLICLPLMYVGNLIGILFSTLLSGGTAENGLINYISDSTPWKIIVVVLLAPLLEEFVFRKQIIDRCGKYGEKPVILLSALTFGLFHMNLYQFFYAFALGLVFAYVYTRTRRLRYSVLMHIIINFMGSVVAPWVLSQVDLNVLYKFSSGVVDEDALMHALPGLMLYCGYVFLLLGLFIAGLVLFIIKVRKLVFFPTPEELPKGQRFKTVYCNVGTILFVLFCIAMCVYHLVYNLIFL